MVDYRHTLEQIFESARIKLSTISPSDWTEANLTMGKPFPGPYRYSRSPYAREIIDCLSPNHPAKIIAVKKGAQIGISAGVIYPALGWIIKNSPGNTAVTVGAPDLMEKTMEKIDLMINSSGLRSYIKPSVVRNRAGKSGDTNLKKEFTGGYVTLLNANNHKSLRQIDLQYGFFDDFEAVKRSSKESGNTRKMLEQRFAAYSDKSKIYYISTPEVAGHSNIDDAYHLGDQRKFMIPCPCCGSFINIEWSTPRKDSETEMAGITWQTDEEGKIIKGTVGYICQDCGDFFNDSQKDIWLNKGFWQPTATPSQEGYYSYHISALYAPHGMFDWEHYVNDYLEANPKDGIQDQSLMKSFTNLVLGEVYEEKAEETKANQLQKNIRQYEIETIPVNISDRDGNGDIILITAAVDLNGIVEDARADYEIVAWSATGSRYSIDQGSVGTFVPREGQMKVKEDRKKWTYEFHKENSVWPEIERILSKAYECDNGMLKKIFVAGIDTGHYTDYAYTFIENSKACWVIGLKGKDTDKYTPFGADIPVFRNSKDRADLFLVEVNKVKDIIAAQMKYKHDYNSGFPQQPGFMNYPIPSGGKYLFDTFFSHYESEKRQVEANKVGGGVSTRWVKKTSNSQNHFWDVHVYNYAVREIFANKMCTELKLKSKTWADFVTAYLGAQ